MARFRSWLLLLLPSCATATFQPEEWGEDGPPAELAVKGAYALGELAAAHGSAGDGLQFALNVRDEWDSTLLRWFTPLTANDQTFEGVLLLHDVVALRIGEQQLRWSRGGEEFTVEGWTAVYADSLYRYFFLPLLDYSAAAPLADADFDGKTYQRLWAQYDEDEVVLWIDPATQRLRFAEFTFRSVSKGYTGVLDYPEWREFEAPGSTPRLLPTEVLVRKGLGKKVVHRLSFWPNTTWTRDTP